MQCMLGQSVDRVRNTALRRGNQVGWGVYCLCLNSSLPDRAIQACKEASFFYPLYSGALSIPIPQNLRETETCWRVSNTVAYERTAPGTRTIVRVEWICVSRHSGNVPRIEINKMGV